MRNVGGAQEGAVAAEYQHQLATGGGFGAVLGAVKLLQGRLLVNGAHSALVEQTHLDAGLGQKLGGTSGGVDVARAVSVRDKQDRALDDTGHSLT